ncbi:MAG TPA: carbohydrate kinase [Candidatus Anaerobutyricum stercoripullorum]|uniref:Carbohydrate kinase n=1 Tax=Candidatus Anaerobutyricum stercoripullorum TaxID=2838456 RepID=A0A9D2BCW7_9FIRM|nr:carbohydrate kinase [Candidatus Anaerobutyricum stercoripullorum]
MSKYDVTALGELLIDFTENGTSAQGNPVLEANPGGAPCNVLSMLNRLGHKTNFIGKIGKDMFGDQLEAALKEVGIGTDGLMKDDEVHTTLAFVHTAPDGDREFSFYRNPGADMMLSEDEVDADQIKNSTIFHFGSLSMTDEVCRKATRKAIAIAEEAGVLMSYDPNLREPLWKSMDLAKEQISYGLEHCNILKISDNEIQWLTGKEDYDEGIAMVQEKYNIPLILLSLGKTGSRAYTKNCRVEVPAFIQENTIETTGAGDTFGACILHYVLEHGWKEYSEAELTEMLTFANAAASIVTTRKGALRVMPTKEEVQAML